MTPVLYRTRIHFQPPKIMVEAALWKASAPDPLTSDQAGKMVDMALISHAPVALHGAKKKPDQEARMRHRKFENDG